MKKEIRFEGETGAQSSFNESYLKTQNCNFELKKPAWIDQHVDKVSENAHPNNLLAKNSKNLL